MTLEFDNNKICMFFCFYHRALQCLVAIELKAVGSQPEFVGKMDMYLEALDRDVKRDNENPSIGIILCPSTDMKNVVTNYD